MKKIGCKTVATLLICGAFMFSSCIGSFALHNKLLSWNGEVTSNKYVNNLIYWALWIVPVYEVCLLADGLVLNTIEFWTGDNPIANVGTVRTIQGHDGRYIVTTLENGYNISKEGQDLSMDLIFDKTKRSWNVVSGGVTKQIMKINANGTVEMTLPNDQALTIIPDAMGVSEYQQAIGLSTYTAMH